MADGKYGVFHLDVQTVTCSVPGDLSVPLGKNIATQFNGVGSTVNTGNSVDFRIDCPSTTQGLTVEATLTDANDATNLTSTLSLANGPREATGVGIRLLAPDGSPILYGAASAVRDNKNQFKLFSTGTAAETRFVSLPVQLVQTEDTIRPGKINAQAIITFSYQ